MYENKRNWSKRNNEQSRFRILFSKKGKTFEELLQSKTPNTIDSVTKNEDWTFTISKNWYTLTIEEKIHRIMIKERKESLHYRNIVENMYTLIVEYLV